MAHFSKRMTPVGQIIEPFAEHHISRPPPVELASKALRQAAQDRMVVVWSPASHFRHPRIQINADSQIRIRDCLINVIKPVS